MSDFRSHDRLLRWAPKCFFTHRRALCNLQALKPKVAVADFKHVLALEPKNDLARTQLDATQKLIRRVEFEKAIEMEEEQNAADRCRQLIIEGK